MQVCDKADSPAGGKEGMYTGDRKLPGKVFTWKSFCLEKFLPGKVFAWKSFCLEKFLSGQVLAWKSFQRIQISCSGASPDLQPGAWSPSNNLETTEN